MASADAAVGVVAAAEEVSAVEVVEEEEVSAVEVLAPGAEEVSAEEALAPEAASPVGLDHRSEAPRHSAGQQRGLPRLRLVRPLRLRGHRVQPFGPARVLVHDQTSEEATSEWEVGHRFNQEIDQTLERAVARLVLVLRHYRVLDQARVLDRGKELVPVRVSRIVPEPGPALRIDPALDLELRTVREPRNFRRIDCRDSVLPQARERWEVRSRIVCRIKERVCKTAWRIGRRWKIAERT